MLEFHDIEQDMEGEWGEMRCGRLTSSSLSKVLANYGKAFGEPAKKLAADIALGQVTGKPISGGYSNDHMMRGHEQEPIARMLYERDTFSEVTNGGFWCDHQIGASPDGMVGEGVIEIKSVIPSVHLATIKRGGIVPAYKWQCIANLYYTGSDWLDFISYCADFPDEKQLYIHRLHREDIADEVVKLVDRVGQFMEVVAECKELILNGEYRT